MSQEQPQPQPQQVFYPSPGPPGTAQQTQMSSSSHSNGSFGPVFIVLAVIVVISAAACVLGRLCNRRKNRAKEGAHHLNKPNKQQSNGLGPKEWETKQKPSFNMRDGDIEFGFDMKKPSAKGVKNGKPPHQNGGGHRPEVRFADNV